MTFLNLEQDFEEKKLQFDDAKVAGLDYFIDGGCWGEESLCMLLQQLTFERNHFRNDRTKNI